MISRQGKMIKTKGIEITEGSVKNEEDSYLEIPQANRNLEEEA